MFWAVTVYLVVTCGFATGLNMVESFRLLPGVHEYWVALVEVLVNVTVSPLQMIVDGMVCTVGTGLTYTVCVSATEHWLPLVTVMV